MKFLTGFPGLNVAVRSDYFFPIDKPAADLFTRLFFYFPRRTFLLQSVSFSSPLHLPSRKTSYIK